MRDSMMLSSLTVGEKQHPKLGGCVRVFFQLFDWNRRLSCKKRIFSPKQLPPERTMRRPFIQHRDDGAETSCSNADVNQVLLLRNGEEEDNSQIKEEEITWEEEGMEKSKDTIHEPETSSVFFSGTGSFNESALKVKSPGVIGKLMGLESLPSPTHPPLTHTPLPKRKQKQKPHATHTPLPASVVIPQHDHTHKVLELAFQHGLPDEELDALLAELNGNMSTILSALPPHIGISSRRSRHRSSSSTTPPTHSTTLPNSPTGIFSSPRSSPVTFSRAKVRATSMVGISSPSKARVSPLTLSRAQGSLTTGVSSCQCPVAENSNQLGSASSLGGHAMCLRDDVFECEEQMMGCTGAGEAEVRNIKNAKKMKQKSITSVGGKSLSEKSVDADIYGVNMELNVPCTPQELQDVERTTCKTVRRKKVDGSIIQQRLQGGVGDHQPLEEKGSLKNSPNDPVVPHRKQEGGSVRGLPYDQSSSSLASRKASKINCAHDPSSTDFAINYNVAFFDEYHKSRSKVGSASKCKHSDDNVADRAQKSNLIAEAVAYHDQRSSNAGSNSDAGPKGEASSLIRVLMNRRVAREAAATGPIKAAGILHTASNPVVNMPAVESNGDDSVQNMISSCNIELDSDPNHREKLSAGSCEHGDRREKLSAGRSEAGGGDFIQVIYPIKYGTVECCRAAASGGNCECSVQAGVIRGRNDQWVVASGLGNAAGLHRGVCMPALPTACTKESGGVAGGRLQREVCGIQAGGGKNTTTAAILQDVISALSTPVSASRPCDHHHHHLSDDDAGTPSTNDGHDTESTRSSGGCWAAASQPSPVSVLISPFDDDVSPGEGDTYWIQSEDDYVAVLLDAMSDTGKRNLPPAELFGKLEERVIAAWPDSEVPPTRGYRRLVFDCVCEALGQAGALKECRGNRRWRAHVLFEEMCQWRRGAGDIVLDDLVEADLKKPCNRWVGFEMQIREIALLLERAFFDLLVEELVCDLVLC